MSVLLAFLVRLVANAPYIVGSGSSALGQGWGQLACSSILPVWYGGQRVPIELDSTGGQTCGTAMRMDEAEAYVVTHSRGRQAIDDIS